MVAAASAIAALSASTVTLSAMPSEKLRPRQPEVAMPRTGDEAVDAEAAVELPAARGSVTRPTSTSTVSPARCKAMSPPLLT